MRRFFVVIFLVLFFMASGAAVSHPATVRIFSTGACLGERLSPQPKGFSLKLVLTTKDGHYLAFVDVSIYKDGKLFARIPSSKVLGPWLYISLPPGTYTIKGKRKNGSVSTVKVDVPFKGMKVVYMRF